MPHNEYSQLLTPRNSCTFLPFSKEQSREFPAHMDTPNANPTAVPVALWWCLFAGCCPTPLAHSSLLPRPQKQGWTQLLEAVSIWSPERRLPAPGVHHSLNLLLPSPRNVRQNFTRHLIPTEPPPQASHGDPKAPPLSRGPRGLHKQVTLAARIVLPYLNGFCDDARRPLSVVPRAW